jgi:acetyl esterase/lipase
MLVPVRGLAVVVATAISSVTLAACGSASSAAGPCRDAPTMQTLQYASYEGVDPNLNSLDLYLPAVAEPCRDRPIVVWVHGGAWGGGDKTEYMADKAKLFNDAGWALASVNYRLTDNEVPNPLRWPVHDQDTADSIAWLVERADEYGIDDSRIAVLGHSAGGGIVAAIAADERYLGEHDLPLDTITCAGSMDGEGYDIVAGNTTSPVEYRPIYADAFGTDPATWEEASPIRYVAPDKGIADYFVAARGPDWRVEQHLAWIDALQASHIPTTVLDSRQLAHADLAVDVGAPGDTVVTPALMTFLEGCFAE